MSATNLIVHATNLIVATFLNVLKPSQGSYPRSCPQCPENTLKLLVSFTNKQQTTRGSSKIVDNFFTICNIYRLYKLSTCLLAFFFLEET